MARANYTPLIQNKLEDFSSQLNGIQTQFVLTNKPRQNSIRIYWNGVLQPQDFFTIINKTVTIERAIDSGHFLAIEYIFDKTQ